MVETFGAFGGLAEKRNRLAEIYFIENEEELEAGWFKNANSVGICGATSTPMWLMQQVADSIKNITLQEA